MNIFYLLAIASTGLMICYLYERTVKQDSKIDRLQSEFNELEIKVAGIVKLLKYQHTGMQDE